MEHVNGWCFRGIYKGGLWENDLHVSAHMHPASLHGVCIERKSETKPIQYMSQKDSIIDVQC